MRTFVTALATCGLLLASQAVAQESKKLTPKPAELPAPTEKEVSSTSSVTAPLTTSSNPVAYEMSPAQCAPLIPHLSTGMVAPTPEMWFYQEELRQYLDPRLAVRRNAEIRANQRRERIAAMKWYGMSNSRPVCCSDPMNGDYSAHWSSGSPNYPNRWTMTPRPWVFLGNGCVPILR